MVAQLLESSTHFTAVDSFWEYALSRCQGLLRYESPSFQRSQAKYAMDAQATMG